MTSWSRARWFVASLPKGTVVRRSEWHARMAMSGLPYQTAETYRLYFTRSGYLAHTGTGRYTRTGKRVPEGLTVKRAYREAYGREMTT